ncbi:MAG TPA: thioredoxin [Candidatus Polarisedimenticolaceae bacterium]|nr:thioredoxin [Candidatus Polarisedimenticolaceae bacterium]
MAGERILTLTEDSFDDELGRRSEPILVSFWASWCGPCRLIAPALEQLALELSGRASVAKVNVDDEGDLANRFGIRSVPTLIVFKNGRVVDQVVGAVPKEQLRGLVERHFSG